jgi:DNA-binding transcriptional LysR family regulator
MNLKSLKVFCDVVGRRSFSRAAEENGISQSGASQIVNHLEEHLDVKLIDRTKRPFVLTPEGEVYYEGCRKLVQRYFALEEEVKTLHEEVSGRVSVASIYSIGLSHMSRFVQSFLKRYPKANVRLQYQHPRRVYELVETDQVDLGLVSYPHSTRTIRATAWREEPMVVVCSPQHSLAGKKDLRLEDLHGLDLVAFDPDLEIRTEIDRALAQRGVEIRVAMEFDNTETIKRAVEINAGMALLPRPTVDREVQSGAVVALPLVGIEMTRPIGIIQRRGKDLGRTASRFMQLLLQSPAMSADDASIGPLEIAALDDADSSGNHCDLPAAESPADPAAEHSLGGKECLPSCVTADLTANQPGAAGSAARVKA